MRVRLTSGHLSDTLSNQFPYHSLNFKEFKISFCGDLESECEVRSRVLRVEGTCVTVRKFVREREKKIVSFRLNFVATVLRGH